MLRFGLGIEVTGRHDWSLSKPVLSDGASPGTSEKSSRRFMVLEILLRKRMDVLGEVWIKFVLV